MTQNVKSFVFSGSQTCPVDMYLLYKSKLHPGSNRLWQRPRQGTINYIDENWYEQRHVGHDPLERFMKHLSSDAKLSKSYTNHSIRATVITTLDNSGFEARHITAISGHKNKSTIKTYSIKCPESKKREMNSVLKKAVLQPKKVKREPTSTMPNPNTPLKTINVNDLNEMGIEAPQEKPELPANFELMPFDDDDATLLKFLNESLSAEAQQEIQQEPTQTENQQQLQLQHEQQKENQQPTNQTTTMSTTTMNKMSTMPVIPKMLINKSNVTINYHIHQK